MFKTLDSAMQSHRPELSPNCVLSYASTDYAARKVCARGIGFYNVMAQQWKNLEESPNPPYDSDRASNIKKLSQ
jgi:hypothetical protein